MAIIGSIRNRMGVLIAGFVGFALLAFILGDFLTSNRSFISGNDTSIGIIGGEKISPSDFDAAVKKQEETIKSQSQKEDLTPDELDRAREMAWYQLTNDKIYGAQFEKLGINVTDDELFDMVQGRFIHPEIKRAFSDPKTGAFNPQQVVQYLKQMDQQAAAGTNAEATKMKTQWLNFEDGIQKERQQEKYNDLIANGLFVTTDEAKADFESKNKNFTIKYVMMNYNTVSDSTVTVNDDDLKKNYNANLYKYKQAETVRTMDFVSFDVMPSTEDRKAASTYINKLVDAFKASTQDSTFVNINSDVKYSDDWKKRGTLPPAVDSIAFAMNKGEVYGPMEDFNSFKLIKIVDKRFFSDSVKVRHILLAVSDSIKNDTVRVAAIKHLGDSLVNLLKGGADFATLVAQYSTDQGSNQKGGEYGWQTPDVNFVPEFKEAMFNGKLKEFQLVRTAFGYHIIQTTDQAKTGSTRIKIANVVRNIEPGNRTFEIMYARANEFSGKNNTKDLFEKASKEQNLRVTPADNLRETDKTIPGLQGNAREVVQWAYKATKGEVSKAFKVDNRYVVAVLKDILEKGYKPLESVKDQVTAEAKRDKKAEKFIETISAQMAGANSIDALAAKLKLTPAEAPNVNFAAPYIANLGMEPALIGAVTSLKQNEMTKPIKGNSGVIVAQVIAITEPPTKPDLAATKNQLRDATKQRAQSEVYNALREKANIKDNRGKYF